MQYLVLIECIGTLTVVFIIAAGVMVLCVFVAIHLTFSV